MRPSVAEAPAQNRRPAFSGIDLALFVVVVAWGVGYAAYRIGQREIPVGLFNFLRYVITTAVFWGILWRSPEDWRLPLRDLPRVAATGIIGVLVYSLVFSTAAMSTNAANLSLLIALSPIWTFLMSWALGHRRPTVGFALGSLVAFTGAAIVIVAGAAEIGFSLETLYGDLLGLTASVIWAWYGIVAGPLLKQHSGLKVQAWISLVALVGFVLLQGPAALRFDWTGVSTVAWICALYVALFVTVYSHLIWYVAIARVGPDRVTLALYLVPVFAAGAGAVFLDQPFGLVEVVGAAVALAGVALVRRSAA